MYRYDVSKTDDGVGGKEGTFCLCTLWLVILPTVFHFHLAQGILPTRCVEALTRAGEFEKPLLHRAISMFEVCGRLVV